MIRSYKIRLLPNQEQEQLLWKHVNTARFVWNFGLSHQMELYKNEKKHLSGYDLKKVFVQLKQQDEYVWLKEISAHTISNVCLDLDSAYKRFFKKQKSGDKYTKNKIKQLQSKNKKLTPYDLNGHPKFKKKNKCKDKFPVRKDSFYLNNNCAVIEKIGKVKYQTNYNFPQGRNFRGEFTNPRIKYINNKWILSFGMECNNQTQKLTDNVAGIDLGISKLAYVSCDDEFKTFNNINKTKKIKKLKKQLKRAQRKVSKKYHTNGNYKKSNNIIKAEKRVKQLHNKLSNIRNNYIHQITRKIVNMFPRMVVMEDLNVSGMMKNRYLSKAIQEQCFYEFIRQMRYKCKNYGIEFVQVDRFYPSSKLCSDCGFIKKDLKLSDRIYNCVNCGLGIDRDENASRNLMNYGLFS